MSRKRKKQLFEGLLLAACLLATAGLFGYQTMALKKAERVEKTQRALFGQVRSAEDALEACRQGPVVLMEDGTCTSGKELWTDFLKKTSREQSAMVLCASYYSGTNHLFYSLIEYDQNGYQISNKACSDKTPESVETFAYLAHYTGKLPQTAQYASYDRYVLVNDETLTWEEIMKRSLSAQSNFFSESGRDYRYADVFCQYFQ